MSVFFFYRVQKKKPNKKKLIVIYLLYTNTMTLFFHSPILNFPPFFFSLFTYPFFFSKKKMSDDEFSDQEDHHETNALPSGLKAAIDEKNKKENLSTKELLKELVAVGVNVINLIGQMAEIAPAIQIFCIPVMGQLNLGAFVSGRCKEDQAEPSTFVIVATLLHQAEFVAVKIQ